MMDIPFTGSGLLGLALCYNKFLIKKLLQTAGIPVPNFQLFHTPNDKLNIDMRFPLISKLNEIHGAVEINQDAVSENEKQLRDRLTYLIKTYNQPVIVEEFISGREITAYVLQGNVTKIYFAEKVFNKPDQKYIFATFDDQWGDSSSDKTTWPYVYAKYEDNLLKDYVKRAFDITDMEDYAKFDVRLDASGRYYFIDSNANPAFGPKELNTSMGLIIQELYGVPFSEILKRLINNTLGVNSESGIAANSEL
jgi:D-alanine-D-alanine ligase